jgi:hypothetical protein
MAKKAQETPKPRVRAGSEPDAVDELLIEVATTLLSDYFFNPDHEEGYQARYPSRKSPPGKDPGTPRGDPPVAEDAIEAGGQPIRWRLDALSNRNGLRLTLTHRSFSAVIEGIWQFQRETLRAARVVERTGTARAITKAAEAAMEEMLAPFAPSEEELEDLMAALSETGDASLMGDNAEEPPPADLDDRARLKQIVDQRTRRPKSELPADDRAWLELSPQLLPVLTEMTVHAMSAAPRQANRIATCLNLLTLQLEFVRYRQDRGWDWANRMLADYQQRLIDLGREESLDQQDWFSLAAALTDARVPVSDRIQQALAEAGMTIADPAPPEELLEALRNVSAEMASMVKTPFEVIEALSSAGAVMPATLRSFMATELSLSPHAMLREAVPMMLLDPDATVRRSAGSAMEQVAGADTVSPDWLRRSITLRNWIPLADRANVDKAIHKARVAGVPIGAWPGTQPGSQRPEREDIVFHASVVDGSGAQSILGVSRLGRKGIVTGLLLKHGIGVTDAWADTDVSRNQINGMLRELRGSVLADEVDRGYVNTVVQHAIRAGLAQGKVPGQKLLEIAERTVSPDWRDRGLDIAAEAEALFNGLEPDDRTPEAGEQALRRVVEWMPAHDVSHSWFEDHQEVHRLIATVPRTDNQAAIKLVLAQILPSQRMAWAERFLLIALWCRAAYSMAHRAWARDFITLAHTVAGAAPLESIPVMRRIAEQTVLTARISGW